MPIDASRLSETSVLVHVGYHKTATTFLQKRVFPKLDVNYITVDNDEQHLDKLLYRDLFQFQAESWRDYFSERFDDRRLNLISEEKFSGHPFIGYLNNSVILHKLQSIFPQAQILIVLRRQTDLLVSMYKEYVKEGGWLRPDAYFSFNQEGSGTNYNIHQNTLNLEVYKFSPFVGAYRQAFGSDNVHVLFYEELFNTAALEDVFERFGITMKVDDFTSKTRVNKGFNQRQLWIATKFNRYLRSQQNPNSMIPPFRIPKIGTINVPKIKRWLESEKIKWFHNSQPYAFSASQQQHALDFYREDNLAMQEMLGRSLPPGYLAG